MAARHRYCIPFLMVALVISCLLLPAVALAQDDPCLAALADDPEQLDAYDALVNEYLQASAAADTERQLSLLDDLRGVCDQNLRLWAFEGNIHAAKGECAPAIEAYQYVLKQAPDWPHPDNAADASSIAEEGMKGLGDSCGTSVAVNCQKGATAQLDGGEPQECPAILSTVPGEHTIRVVDADGNETFNQKQTFEAGNTVVSPGDAQVAGGGGEQGGGGDQGGGAQGGGGDEGGGVVPEEPGGKSDMAIQLGVGGGIGLATLSEDAPAGIEPIDADPGFAWEVRGYVIFRFVSWLGAGLNAGFLGSSHNLGSQSSMGFEQTVTGRLRAATVGLILRFELGSFIIAPWLNYATGSTDFEACTSGPGIPETCDTSPEVDGEGFDIGVDLFWSINLFTNGYLDLGLETAYRQAENTDLKDDVLSQFYVGFSTKFHYEIPL